jgi:hypothetical protein
MDELVALIIKRPARTKRQPRRNNFCLRVPKSEWSSESFEKTSGRSFLLPSYSTHYCVGNHSDFGDLKNGNSNQIDDSAHNNSA